MIVSLEKTMKRNVKAMEQAKTEAIAEFKTLKTTIGENKALSELKISAIMEERQQLSNELSALQSFKLPI